MCGRDEGASGERAARHLAGKADLRRARASSARCASRPRLGLAVDHRADVGGGIARDRRASSSAAAPSIIASIRSATSSCRQSRRSAEQRWPAERKAEAITSSVDLLGQRGGVDDHGIDAAGLGDERHDRAVLGGERPVDRPGDLGRAGEGDAGHGRMRDQRRADPRRRPARAAPPRAARRPGAAARRRGRR